METNQHGRANGRIDLSSWTLGDTVHFVIGTLTLSAYFVAQIAQVVIR